MRYLVALAIALMVWVGMPVATNAAPDDQVIVEGVIPYYTDWLASYQPSYVVVPALYRPVRPYYRVYRAGYSACWYIYC